MDGVNLERTNRRVQTNTDGRNHLKDREGVERVTGGRVETPAPRDPRPPREGRGFSKDWTGMCTPDVQLRPEAWEGDRSSHRWGCPGRVGPRSSLEGRGGRTQQNRYYRTYSGGVGSHLAGRISRLLDGPSRPTGRAVTGRGSRRTLSGWVARRLKVYLERTELAQRMYRPASPGVGFRQDLDPGSGGGGTPSQNFPPIFPLACSSVVEVS